MSFTLLVVFPVLSPSALFGVFRGQDPLFLYEPLQPIPDCGALPRHSVLFHYVTYSTFVNLFQVLEDALRNVLSLHHQNRYRSVPRNGAPSSR